MQDPSLLEAIRAFVAAREWEPFHDPKNLAMAVASEAGELCSELRWVASEQADAFARRPDVRARLEDEAADVAITLLMFCDRAGIDLASAMRAKLRKNALKYPVGEALDAFRGARVAEHLLPGEADLTLMPMAVRRALDRAGRKLALRAWQAMPMATRERLVELGASARIDARAVEALIDGAQPAAEVIEASPDPSADEAPSALSCELATWQRIGPVARHALASYLRRGKLEKARALLAELEHRAD